MEKLNPVTDKEWDAVNPVNKELYNDYFQNNVELSDKTVKTYKSNLRIWFNWVRLHCKNKEHTKIKSIDYKRFQNWLVSRGCSSSDIATKRSSISSLNKYIEIYYEEEYPMFRNFINSAIKMPEKEFKNTKIPPTKEELLRMIHDIEESDIKDKYEKIAYLKFTFETGCRREETRQLTKDVVDKPPIIKVIKTKDDDGNEVEREVKYYLTDEIRCKGRGKTGKVRKFKFSDWSMDALKKWIEERGEDNCPYVFTTKNRNGVKQVCETVFNEWATAYFTPLLGRRFHPHCLREARATDIVVNQGKNIEVAQSLLGHASAETTKIYVINDNEDEESDELFFD
jgi:integrase